MTAAGRAAPVLLAGPLSWREVSAIVEGSVLELSAAARERIVAARTLVEAVVAGDAGAYRVNTGVGALCDTVVDGPCC